MVKWRRRDKAKGQAEESLRRERGEVDWWIGEDVEVAGFVWQPQMLTKTKYAIM